MNISSLYRQLNSVRSVGSRRSKENVLYAIDSPIMRKVLSLTYDNRNVFGLSVGISQLGITVGEREIPVGDREVPFYLVEDFLDNLMSRALVGNAARDSLYNILEGTSLETQELVARIINKDLDVGIATNTINSVFPGLIYVCSMQLAKGYTDKKACWPMLGEVKYDGKRSGWLLASETVSAFSRNGKTIDGYEHIYKALKVARKLAGRDLMLDGELMWGMFGERKEENAILRIYDIMSLAEWNMQRCVTPQRERSREVQEFCRTYGLDGTTYPIAPTESRMLYSYAEALAFYNEVIAKGGEGIMLKDPSTAYGFKRDHRWMKMKPTLEADLRIVDTFEGEGKYEGMLGGIVVDHKGMKVRVGAGFSDAQRYAFWNQYSQGPDYLVGLTAEVRYTEVTPDGSLRFPRFVKIRDDK